jgi:hypothetical protein
MSLPIGRAGEVATLGTLGVRDSRRSQHRDVLSGESVIDESHWGGPAAWAEQVPGVDRAPGLLDFKDHLPSLGDDLFSLP